MLRTRPDPMRLPTVLVRWFSGDAGWRTASTPNEPLEALLRALRATCRPSADGSVSVAPLLQHLGTHPGQAAELGRCIAHLMHHAQLRSALTDPGIVAYSELRGEVWRRLTLKLLPELPEEGTVERVLVQVLHRPGDTGWFLAVPEVEWTELLRLTSLERAEGRLHADIPQAAVVLAHRINGRTLEPGVLRMVPGLGRHESPFLALQRHLDDLQERLLAPGASVPAPDDPELQRLRHHHGACSQLVEQAFANSAEIGISVRVTQNLVRVQQQLQRLKVLLELIGSGHLAPAQRTVQLMRVLVAINGGRNEVSALLEESTRLVAYEITQHTGRTGEHYITSSGREYRHMFASAAVGGAIVAVMCVVKVFLSYLHPPLFGKALLASLNYAWGFILIYLVGATLATKQPAMTAAALVKSLNEHRGEGQDHGAFAELFARLFRSQFIAFVGNVLLAFPVALGLVWGIGRLTGHTVGATKWPGLIDDLQPFTSLALFHAAIAGVFLFLSGIIAGSVSNRGRFDRIPQRIAEHPGLRRTFGARRAKALGRFYDRRWAGILSNLWFGVFMGSTAAIGIFFGLALDIRHITFAAGNLAIALHAAPFPLPVDVIAWSVLGIGLIGLVNFLVSFILSLGLAMRSRSMPITELDDLARAVWRHFRRYPLRFFVPTRDSTGTQGPGH